MNKRLHVAEAQNSNTPLVLINLELDVRGHKTLCLFSLLIYIHKTEIHQEEPLSKKIFIIEDDTSIRTTLMELLTMEGYDVHPYPHGQAGLDGLQTASVHPNLILLDLMMPVMDGYEFLLQIQKYPEMDNIPILVLSADGQATTKLSRERIKAFIKKPIDLDPFLNAVESFVV